MGKKAKGINVSQLRGWAVRALSKALVFASFFLLIVFSQNECQAGTNPESSLKYGPVFGLVLPNSMTMQWSTNSPVHCTVKTEDCNQKAVTDDGFFHFVRIEGLKPGEPIEGKIIVEETANQIPFSFSTPVKSPETWDFIAYGDTQALVNKHEEVVHAIENESEAPNFCFLLGDLTYHGGIKALWDNFFSIEKPLMKKLPFLSCLGNHDERGQEYFGLFYNPLSDVDSKRAWYSFRYQNAVFLVLDPKSEVEPQIDFTQRVLERANEDGIEWKIVICHYPPISSGKHGGDPILKERFVPLFEKYGVNLGLFGHEHINELNVKNNVTYLTVRGSGPTRITPTQRNPYSLWVSNELSFARIRVSPQKMEVNLKGVDGKIINSFSLEASKANFSVTSAKLNN
ncbi:MAG: metallophosphoesterase [Candidatus Riflebacteria bacterium]|nr:metallophosphoesterase [Candidatus Riflebacteria bacterium]